MAATIGTITGAPSGMSTSISSNGTTSASFTVSVTSSLTTGQGVLTVPITVDGKSFTKNFSFSVAFKGNTGATGATGVGIKSITEYYFGLFVIEWSDNFNVRMDDFGTGHFIFQEVPLEL